MNRDLTSFPEALNSSVLREEVALIVAKNRHDESNVETLASPSLFLSAYFNNLGLKSRIDALSIEQALYFLPYQESTIPTDMIRTIKEENMELFDCFSDEELSSARSELGETLVHLACRLNKLQALTHLLLVSGLPLNVKDQFGRNPLHNACSAVFPNFAVVDLLLSRSPDLVLYEDEKGKTPFEYIPCRLNGLWTRYISEKNVLKALTAQKR